MKSLLLTIMMLLLSSISYADSIDILPNSDETSSTLSKVQFDSKLNKTKWESLEGNKKVIFEFDAPYIITKVYKDSILENVRSTKIISYNNMDNLHFFFYAENNTPIIFHRVKKKVLYRIIIGNSNSSVTNIILKPNKK